MVAADFAINPEIFFSDANTAGVAPAASAVGGGLFGALVGGFSKKETQVSLTMIDNRSGVQIASAIGHASAADFWGLGSLGGSPYAAIAAGAALVAIGKLASSGIQRALNGSSSASTSTGSDSTTRNVDYSGELTVYVEGRIKGDDIVISGQRSLNAWNR